MARPGSSGQLQSGPNKEDGLVRKTLDFISHQLPAWRDDPKRPHDISENDFNSSLYDFLDCRSRTDLPMARFKHQAPQAPTRTVDIGVQGTEDTTLINAIPYSIYEPFLVIEGKRLPAPTKKREREYVTGVSPTSRSPSGGIQRFKLGLHGSRVENAVMIGYIERQEPRHWYAAINGWMADLVDIKSTDGCVWTSAEKLGRLLVNDISGTAVSDSTHQRSPTCVTPEIKLSHFWVVMES